MFRGNNFFPKILLTPDSLSVLQDFPKTNAGRLELSFSRHDRKLAQDVITKIRSVRPGLLEADSIEFDPRASQRNFAVFLCLLFMAIVNSGFLAIFHVLNANYAPNTASQAIFAVLFSVVLSPLIAAQFFASIWHLVTGDPTVTEPIIIASMLPITPACVIGIPFGGWAIGWFRSIEEGKSAAAIQPKGWGATTMIFLREPRNARLVRVLETSGIVVAGCFVAIIGFGLYPCRLNYRISTPTESTQSIIEPIRSRLTDLTGVFVSSKGDTRFTVYGWSFQRKSIESRLSLPRTLQIVLIAREGHVSSSNNELDYPPLAVGLDTSIISDGERQPKDRVAIFRDSQLLSSDLVSKVIESQKEKDSKRHSKDIRLELSSSGRAALEKLLESHRESAAFGLVVDGVIEAVASPVLQDHRTIEFQIDSQSVRSIESIRSAIRGPEIPSEIELLK